jgi:hypothetical protein
MRAATSANAKNSGKTPFKEGQTEPHSRLGVRYAPVVRADDLRAFAKREWAAVERAKLDYWLELTRAEGPAAALRAADALRRHAAAHAGLGGPEERTDDLRHHVELKRRIDAASRRLRR